MLERWLDHLPWNPLLWELIFISLLVVIALAPIGRRKRTSPRKMGGAGEISGRASKRNARLTRDGSGDERRR